MSLMISGRAVYPSLFTPAEFPNDDPAKRKYQLTLMIDKEQDITELRKACAAAAKEKWGDKMPAKMVSPINDGDADDANSNFAGCWYIRAKTQRAPGVVDRRNQVVTDQELIGSGDYVRITCNAYAYDVGGNKGVALGLNNVQFVGKGDPIGAVRPAASSEFEPLEVGQEETANAGSGSGFDDSIPF